MYIKSGLLGYQGLKAPIAIDTRETKQILVTLDKIFPVHFSSCDKPVSVSKLEMAF